MKRREFLTSTLAGVGAVGLASKALVSLPQVAADTKFSAADVVVLGKTAIRTSRLACGTGTQGSNKQSHQTRLGIQGLADLLCHGYDQGLRFWDCADSYGSHPHVAAALRRVPRDKVAVLTKSWARDPGQMRADLDRFRREFGTEYIDVLLMHCLTDDDWPERYKGTMDVISEAQQKGIVRAHGVSCHTLGALSAAAKSPWVQVVLARINPVGAYMDASPDRVVPVLREMRAAGKGIVGMKILGQGELRNHPDEALRYALSLGLLHAFTIGAENQTEQEDLIRRIAAVRI
jgi:1-deoxyxylulose-5-phosphate synthase